MNDVKQNLATAVCEARTELGLSLERPTELCFPDHQQPGNTGNHFLYCE